MSIKNETALPKEDVRLLRHCLGCSEHISKRNWFYRNYGAFAFNDEQVKRLLDQGYLVRCNPAATDYVWVCVSNKGVLSIGLSDFHLRKFCRSSVNYQKLIV